VTAWDQLLHDALTTVIMPTEDFGLIRTPGPGRRDRLAFEAAKKPATVLRVTRQLLRAEARRQAKPRRGAK
jgi:hypothetical protein